MRARAKHARAVWDLIGNRPITTPVSNNGLVNDAGAVTDAQAALALPQLSGDWKFEFQYSPSSVGPVQAGVFYSFGSEVNDRQEMRLGDVYVVPSANNKTWTSVDIMDPIDNIADPVANAVATAFKNAATYPVFTVVSRRELHLILAEAALRTADTATFATQINAVRALGPGALTPWNPASPQVPALTLLTYERQVNLFLQGRRLADHYRFGIPSPRWQPSSEAVTQPGRFLPITARECLSNTFIGAANCREG
jgi:starch-binding outer membrane protein, SusD/RagB family